MNYLDYFKNGGEPNLNTIAHQFKVNNVLLPQPEKSKLYSYSFLEQLFNLWKNEKVSSQNNQNTSVDNSNRNIDNRGNGSIRSSSGNPSKHGSLTHKLITPSNIQQDS